MGLKFRQIPEFSKKIYPRNEKKRRTTALQYFGKTNLICKLDRISNYTIVSNIGAEFIKYAQTTTRKNIVNKFKTDKISDQI